MGIKRKRNIVDVYKRTLSKWRRLNRLAFPSPAEMAFLELMGGRVHRLGINHPRSKFPMAFVLRRPALFRDERVVREKRAGSKYVDFGNDVMRAIEIDGRAWHTDEVAEFDRDSYLYMRGWQVMHIKAYEIYNQPAKVYAKVYKYLTK